MHTDSQLSPLIAYLKRHRFDYYGKCVELRHTVQGWLEYIPNTFPHYTRHTITHSDEIISQMSQLLFRDDRPMVALSPIEAYILITAAYLHDVGMVVPDRVKATILASSEWKHWIAHNNGGAKRWQAIEAMRNDQLPLDSTERHFLADVQTRFLVAEFVRRTHHQRTAHILTHHREALRRFDFDDPILFNTITAVCIAHGLNHYELEDQERYPDRRNIQGQLVNVRFCAIVLRLGDLLDMSHDRACPLLLNAACPLPGESLAYWSQYQRFRHRLTTPDCIEVIAECTAQEEHRFLQDWCQWLVDEVDHAKTLMAGTKRHSEWRLPRVSLDGAAPTIKIRPTPEATYIPTQWRFELQQNEIYERLIGNLYSDPMTFVRELIQNALDATRCQMYIDLDGAGQELPPYPTHIEAAFRDRYTLHIHLQTRLIPHEQSGELAQQQVLIVEDQGIGMDQQIIQHYLLQIGRSYYTSEDFRRSFGFIPTSQFGLGFLSVFAVSENIIIESYKPTSRVHSQPLRLKLTGPQNYLLIEQGSRSSSGTRIEVLLRKPLQPGQLTAYITNWCRRVELPIIVNDLGQETTITAEQSTQFCYDMPHMMTEGICYTVRAFPVNRPGIEGELYVFVQSDQRGESWKARRDLDRYFRRHPLAHKLPFPGNLACFHGITLVDDGASEQSARQMSARIDFRNNLILPTLSRDALQHHRSDVDWQQTLESRWEEILSEHLATAPRATSEHGWKYKQQLVSDFPLSSFWETFPGMIRIYQRGQSQLVSLRELQTAPTITTVLYSPQRHRNGNGWAQNTTIPATNDNDIPCLIDDDLQHLSTQHCHALFDQRQAVIVHWLVGDYLAIDWQPRTVTSLDYWETAFAFHIVPLPSPTTVGCTLYLGTAAAADKYLLNATHPFVQWLKRVRYAHKKDSHLISKNQWEMLLTHLRSALVGLDSGQSLLSYLTGWHQIPDLPPNLYPPHIGCELDTFTLHHAREQTT
ncbi:MAG: chaperone protein [Chloroflexi bacterium AL-N10]|nr:chaperone protein [Chloroflexi bacterium AL-N1]NOK69569.1 chaperone protein [Chloroflexi bacterium AL-N10]NOK77534.1 chaperone protein [Chloroflexi bacterium AL-N5]NOK91449.1 chaperone protein [Chloroflexi bacterium AL-N15]